MGSIRTRKEVLDTILEKYEYLKTTNFNNNPICKQYWDKFALDAKLEREKIKK